MCVVTSMSADTPPRVWEVRDLLKATACWVDRTFFGFKLPKMKKSKIQTDLKRAQREVSRLKRLAERNRKNRQRAVDDKMAWSHEFDSSSDLLLAQGIEPNPGPNGWRGCMASLRSGKHPDHECSKSCLLVQRARCDRLRATLCHPDHACREQLFPACGGCFNGQAYSYMRDEPVCPYLCKVVEEIDQTSYFKEGDVATPQPVRKLHIVKPCDVKTVKNVEVVRQVTPSAPPLSAEDDVEMMMPHFNSPTGWCGVGVVPSSLEETASLTDSQNTDPPMPPPLPPWNFDPPLTPPDDFPIQVDPPPPPPPIPPVFSVAIAQFDRRNMVSVNRPETGDLREMDFAVSGPKFVKPSNYKQWMAEAILLSPLARVDVEQKARKIIPPGSDVRPSFITTASLRKRPETEILLKTAKGSKNYGKSLHNIPYIVHDYTVYATISVMPQAILAGLVLFFMLYFHCWSGLFRVFQALVYIAFVDHYAPYLTHVYNRSWLRCIYLGYPLAPRHYTVVPDWVTCLLSSSTSFADIRANGLRRIQLASGLNISSGNYMAWARDTIDCTELLVAKGFTIAPANERGC